MTAEYLSTFHTRLCIFINTFCTPKISEECEWLVLLYIQGYQMRQYYFRCVFKLPLPCKSCHLIDRECAIREQHRKVVGMDHPFLPTSVRKAMMKTEVYLYACLCLIWWQMRDFLWTDVSIWYITVTVSCRFHLALYDHSSSNVHIISGQSWCPLCKHNPFMASLLLKWLTALNVWDQMMLSKLLEKTKDCKRHHAEEMMRVWFIWRHGILIWASFILFIIFMFISSVPRGIVLFGLDRRVYVCMD